MNLHSYLVRLESMLNSRQDIQAEAFQITLTSIGVVFRGELRFYDGSRLSIIEEIVKTGPRSIKRINYKFHYQSADGNMMFRYDNAPHHPHLATHPAHKHIGDKVTEAHDPDLSEVLAEIDAILCPGL